ncbi:hypothetical protein FACS1894186_8280 [Alphaproteobacteria bacterium]|nr:hypothetical protein FACS1894186_8280 [Alphaproteobacteria bacterium]
MKNTASKITSKGQLTVPCYIRAQSGLAVGDTVEFETKDDYIIIRKAKNLMDYVGCLGRANLPDDLEELMTPDVAAGMVERK